MDAKEFIKEYKEKEFLISVNFEGSLMVSEDKLIEMLEEYHQAKLNEAEEVEPCEECGGEGEVYSPYYEKVVKCECSYYVNKFN